ncbi:MAG: hypothetical protein L0K86_15475 [Actinomycetia bacterium]|nr:hypothetical protein [Actinomycetes bacterium]
MANSVPPPSTKPVWPIVVACLVLVAGIMVAAVFIGMNLSDSDNNNVANRDDAPAYAGPDSGSKQKSSEAAASDEKQSDEQQSDDGKQNSSDSDESESPEKSKDEKSDEPKDEESDEPKDEESESSAEDPRLDCGSASTVLTTRTAEFGASICRTADGDHVYRGMSVNIDGSLVLHATLNEATDMWVATNKTTEYTVDADTGQLTIRNAETGEVYGSQPAVKFHTK